MTVDRRRVVLGAGAAVVLGVAAWTFWPASVVTTAAPPSRARNTRASAADKAPGPAVMVKMEALTASREEPGEVSRNPFRFQPKVVAPPPRPTMSVAPPPPIEVPRPAVPAGPPPPPPIPLKFIGVLERASGVKWAVLSDGKSPSPFYGKDGDIIDGRYMIVKIGVESIEMTHADGRGRQVIRLTGQ